MGGVDSSLQPPTDIWDPGKLKVLGERTGGFVLSSGCTIPVDFDTNSAVCVIPKTIFNNYFPDKHVYSFEEKIFDIQETSIPYEVVVCISTDGIQSLRGVDLSIPLNIEVPFLIVEHGDSLILSARWMDKRHLDILKFMDTLYEDCIEKVKDDGIWRVRVIAPCSLSLEEWNLCYKYHSTIKFVCLWRCFQSWLGIYYIPTVKR